MFAEENSDERLYKTKFSQVKIIFRLIIACAIVNLERTFGPGERNT